MYSCVVPRNRLYWTHGTMFGEGRVAWKQANTNNYYGNGFTWRIILNQPKFYLNQTNKRVEMIGNINPKLLYSDVFNYGQIMTGKIMIKWYRQLWEGSENGWGLVNSVRVWWWMMCNRCVYNLPHVITFISSLIIDTQLDISSEKLLYTGFAGFLLLVTIIIIREIYSRSGH